MKFKKLAVITDCIHFDAGEGKVGTLNHVLMRQLQALAIYFESVVICCPFVAKPQQARFSTYNDKRISFLKSAKVGGDSVAAKWKIITTIPSWLRLYQQINSVADIVYMRFPNNISIPAFFYFLLRRKKSFATFTAPWYDDNYSSASTNFQRWLLKKFFKGPVWVFAKNNELPGRFYKNFSPSYTHEIWEQQQAFIQQKATYILTHGIQTLKLIAVGSLDERKNHIYILKNCALLKHENIPFILTIVGTGELSQTLQEYIQEKSLCDCVCMAGYKNDAQLQELYKQHDFVIQSSISEAYGKVPVEGFFFGLIPLVSNTSQMADEFTNDEKGFVFNINDEQDLYTKLRYIYSKQDKEVLAKMMVNGNNYASTLTIENWARSYINTLNFFYA